MALFGQGGQVFQQSPADRRRSLLSQRLLAQGTDVGPVQHPVQGLARVAQALSGAFISKNLDEQSQGRQKATQEALANALGGTQVAGPGGISEGPKSLESIIQSLNASGDPQAQAFGQQLQLGQFQNQQKLNSQLSLARQKQELEGPKGLLSPEAEEQKIRLGRQGQILSPEALAQKEQLARAGRNQSFGTVPAGFQVVQEGGVTRMVPIPGGPAAQEAQAAEEQRAAKETQVTRSADVVVEDIDRSFETMESASLPTTGGLGVLLSNIDGTAAKDLGGTLRTIKANVGFDRLQQMRESSPTGGALGAVSELENKLLQSVLGNLEQSQNKEELKFNLRRLRGVYLDIIHGPGNRPGAETGEGGFTVRKVQ